MRGGEEKTHTWGDGISSTLSPINYRHKKGLGKGKWKDNLPKSGGHCNWHVETTKMSICNFVPVDLT